MNNIPTLHSPPPTPPLGKSGDKDLDLIKNHDKRTWFFQLISLEGMQQFRFTGFCGLLKPNSYSKDISKDNKIEEHLN